MSLCQSHLKKFQNITINRRASYREFRRSYFRNTCEQNETIMSNKGTFQADSDTHISFEDQQKINQFAKLNAKLRDLQEELVTKENDFKNIEEACEEVELMDEDEKIPYLVGEVFMYEDLKKIQENLENDKKENQEEIDQLKSECERVQDAMSDLKGHLYGKFGSHINLEPDE